MYPYLYFYKMPIRLWISCTDAQRAEGPFGLLCFRFVLFRRGWVGFFFLFPAPLRGLIPAGWGGALSHVGPGIVGGSNFLCNPTPLVVLILRNKRKAELFKFKWGSPWVEGLLALHAKMGLTWGHRWPWGFVFGGPTQQPSGFSPKPGFENRS